jgi:hypothetical protein
MGARDTHVHGRKTTAGLDLTFGRTTTTPCGKTREITRTSVDPGEVTCPGCREWAAQEERRLAEYARLGGAICRQQPEMVTTVTADGFDAIADGHLARAAQWNTMTGRSGQ